MRTSPDGVWTDVSKQVHLTQDFGSLQLEQLSENKFRQLEMEIYKSYIYSTDANLFLQLSSK